MEEMYVCNFFFTIKLRYLWASLVTQMVKNSPAMWETWVRSLGWEDPLEKGKATHSSTVALRLSWTVLGSQRDTSERLLFSLSLSSADSSH